MDSLKIAFVTPEAVPFAKTGGLADVAGALPGYLAGMGHEVRVFIPKYRQVDQNAPNLDHLNLKLSCRINDRTYEGDVYHLPGSGNGPEFYFPANDFFYNRRELYRDPQTDKDYVDNAERYIFFSRVVLQAIRNLNWQPDIIHANDWQSGLVAAYLKIIYKEDDFFQGSRAVFSIHNMGYQGIFPPETFPKLGIGEEYFRATGPFEFWGDVNFMKSAIHFADWITTVSPTYAKEIQSADEFGKGLQDVLKERSETLSGILNGVDYSIWSPQKDRLISHRYHPANLSGKKKNKLELLHRCGLPIRMEHPLIGVISRLDVQKGFDLLEKIMDDILGLDLQFVLLGTGDEKYHVFFREKEEKYPDRFKASLQFNNELAHLIEAGADIFLMPSRYEPCGLNQMYSLRYGTVPIVRRTGGLADTVADFDEAHLSGTGFVFENYNAAELLRTIRRAVELFRRKRIWYKIMKQGMAADFSWDRSAQEYSELYQSLMASRN